MLMNVIDGLLGFVILLAVWSGWQKGFMQGLADLVVAAGSVVAAFYLYPYAALLFNMHAPSLGIWTLPVSFTATLLLARLVIAAITNLILKTIPAAVHAHDVNRLSGIFPGFVTGVINAIILAALLLTVPMWNDLSERTRDSRLAARLTGPAEWLEAKISPVFNEAVRNTMHNLTVEPGSDESVKLPFTLSTPALRPDLETKMLEMVNAERQQKGLNLLKPDPELTEVARSHSRDMFAKGYFAHNTPDGKDPFDRMRAAGVHFLTAGENLALAQTLFIAHNGLMHSPGHRANILRPAFGRVGIGILDGGIYGLMISQEFRN